MEQPLSPIRRKQLLHPLFAITVVEILGLYQLEHDPARVRENTEIQKRIVHSNLLTPPRRKFRKRKGPDMFVLPLLQWLNLHLKFHCSCPCQSCSAQMFPCSEDLQFLCVKGMNESWCRGERRAWNWDWIRTINCTTASHDGKAFYRVSAISNPFQFLWTSR